MSSLSSGAFGQGGTVGAVLFLEGNSGGEVGPSGSGIIDVVGDGVTTLFTGNPGANTLTGTLTGITQYALQVGLSGTTLTNLAIGSSGQVLTSNGAGSNPSFQTPSSGGITQIDADLGGGVSGSTVSILANTGFAGASAEFVAVSSNQINLKLTDSSSSTYLGQNAGSSISGSPASNTSLGFASFSGLSSSTVTGNANVCLGVQSGHLSNSSISGSVNLSQNVFIGNNSVTNTNLSAGSSFNNNVYIGASVVSGSTSGAQSHVGNIAIGYQALQNAPSPAYNVIIGYQAGNQYTSNEEGNIIIAGGGSDPSVTGDFNTIRIGGQPGTFSFCFIDGINMASVTGSAVLIDPVTGQLGVTVSSAKFKDNIQDMDSSAVLNLRPVTFNYKGATAKHYGLIAEEVEAVMPDLVIYDKHNAPQTVMYHELPAILLNEIKKLNDRIKALEAR